MGSLKRGLKFRELTNSEKEILHLLSDEFLTIKQIAQRRDCSVQYVYRVIKKLKEERYLFKEENFIPSKIEDKLNIFCYFCDYSEVLDRHHIIERKDGGNDEDDNFLTLCPNCHTLLHRKGKLIFEDGFYSMVNTKTGNIILRPSRLQRGYKRDKPELEKKENDVGVWNESSV